MELERLVDIQNYSTFRKIKDYTVLLDKKWLVWHNIHITPLFYTFETDEVLQIESINSKITLTWQYLPRLNEIAIITSTTETISYSIYQSNELDTLLLINHYNNDECLLLCDGGMVKNILSVTMDYYFSMDKLVLLQMKRQENNLINDSLLMNCFVHGILVIGLGLFLPLTSEHYLPAYLLLIFMLGMSYILIPSFSLDIKLKELREKQSLSSTVIESLSPIPRIVSDYRIYSFILGSSFGLLLFIFIAYFVLDGL